VSECVCVYVCVYVCVCACVCVCVHNGMEKYALVWYMVCTVTIKCEGVEPGVLACDAAQQHAPPHSQTKCMCTQSLAPASPTLLQCASTRCISVCAKGAAATMPHPASVTAQPCVRLGGGGPRTG